MYNGQDTKISMELRGKFRSFVNRKQIQREAKTLLDIYSLIVVKLNRRIAS